MQFEEMGNMSGKILMLLPGTCCDWQTNFGTVIDSLDYEVELGVILKKDAFQVTVEEAISELSQGMTLKSGTIIATGTPGGVGMGFKPPKFLQQGDIVKCNIDKLGELVNSVGN